MAANQKQFEGRLFDFSRDVGVQLVDPDALLLHSVAVAHRDAAVLDGVEVVGDAERRADLVLTGVFAPALPDQMEIVTDASPNMKVGNKYLSGAVVTLRYTGEVEEGYSLIVSANGTALQEENGVYTVTVTENTEITALMLHIGGVNGDGEVAIEDATHLQMYLAEFDVVPGEQPA